jgi:hypothetical protein
MKIQKRVLFSFLALTIFSMFFAVYAANTNDNRKLGVEINTKNSFYIPAAVGNRTITGLVRVGKSENASADDITGLKIIPKIENGKVRVEVLAVYGDIRNVKSCNELDAFKSKSLGSQVLGKGESLNLSELANLKQSENNESLQVKIVGMKKDFNDNTFEKVSATAQLPGCGSCGNTICCPNAGKCIECGDCGLVCNGGGDNPPPQDGE